MEDFLARKHAQERLRQNDSPPLVPSNHQIRHPAKIKAVKACVSRALGLKGIAQRCPAPNPVSLGITGLKLLQQKPYCVAEKCDGQRFLLVLTRYPRTVGGHMVAVLVNRRWDMYEIAVQAPQPLFRGTVLDGELVVEHPRQVWLGFDLWMLSGDAQVGRQVYPLRHKGVERLLDMEGLDCLTSTNWLEDVTALASKCKIVCEGNCYGLTFRPKPLWPASETQTVWEQRDQLRHLSDGLVFTPRDAEVRPYTQTSQLKWKPVPTIDLLWKTTYNVAEQEWEHRIFMQDGQDLVDVTEAGLTVTVPEGLITDLQQVTLPAAVIPNSYLTTILQWADEHAKTDLAYVGEFSCRLPSEADFTTLLTAEEDEDPPVPVVECYLLRLRHDKTGPNHCHVVRNTLRDLAANVSIRDILKHVVPTDPVPVNAIPVS